MMKSLILLLGILSLVQAIVQDRVLLSNCMCKDDRSRPDCDFGDLSKKKLLALSEKLFTSQVVCVGVGEGVQRFVPTFTSLLLPLDRVLQPGPSGSINVDGLMSDMKKPKKAAESKSQIVPAKPKPPTCAMDGLTCTAQGVQLLFPSAVLVHDLIHDEKARRHNEELKTLLLELEEDGEGCDFHLHGGYRSKDGLLDKPDAAIQWLKNEITPRVKHLLSMTNSSLPFRIDGWGQVLRSGDGQDPHVHPASMFAGVYYVAAPKEVSDSGKSGGCLRILDPRPGAAMAQVVRGKSLYGDTIEICPNETGGLMVIFPPYLMHEVKPMPEAYKSPRIAISFNVIYKP